MNRKWKFWREGPKLLVIWAQHRGAKPPQPRGTHPGCVASGMPPGTSEGCGQSRGRGWCPVGRGQHGSPVRAGSGACRGKWLCCAREDLCP